MNSEKFVPLNEAKKIDLVDYLSSLGYVPAPPPRGDDYWYLSPLHNEKTPSFKVDRKKNVWYDHGVGKGGTLIDFGIQFFNCSIREFLEKLKENTSLLSGQIQFRQDQFQNTQKQSREPKLIISRVFPISSFSLLTYLKKRGITFGISDKFCKEVSFRIEEKTYYGIGFKNDLGGYEIRNQFFKSSSAPKGITTIDNGASKVAVFEGFFDFLSFQMLREKPSFSQLNYTILNSLAFFESARPFMERHDQIHLFLDYGTGGQNCSQLALSYSKKYIDERELYKGFDDLNDWLVGAGQNQSIKRSLKM